MTLYLFSKHNYYNRKIRRFDTIGEYEDWLDEVSLSFSGIDFKPGDGISTKQIINYPANSDFAARNVSMSYCIVADEGDIVSRWWIIGCNRVRYGQVELTLLRDIIADYYDEVMSCPSFMNKGWIQTAADNAIFNNEDMTFNQIKTSEIQIRDKSQTAWYVAYISKDVADKTITISSHDVNTTDTFDTWDQYSYYQYTQSNPFVGDYADVAFQLYGYEYNYIVNDDVTFCVSWDANGQPSNLSPSGYLSEFLNHSFGEGITATGARRGYKIKSRSNFPKVFTEASKIEWKPGSYGFTGAHSETATNTFLEEDGRFIRVGGKAYKVKVVSIGTTTPTTINIDNTNIYADKFRTVASNSDAYNTSATIVGNISSIIYTAPKYYLTYEEVAETGFSFTIPANRQHTEGCPYDIVAIPANFCYIHFGDALYINNEALAQSIINGINTELADTEIFDIQLLPYAPLGDEYIEGRTIRLNLMENTEDITYSTKLTSGTLRTAIVYAGTAEFKKKISDYKITIPVLPKDFKIANECDMYRLCSPNYNGQFEFSAAKNYGVDGWNISYTYKPYTPYIKVAPAFKRLYGRDFGDARGLVVGGDFSISQVNDAWKSYELNNKNYQVMFDRQIQNMEVNNSVARTMDTANMLTGTVQGGASGFMLGSMGGGGPIGGIAGAAIGTVTSAAGGIVDMALNEKLRKEALQFAKDQFGYQLQNIKALPYSLTKIGSQNSDYKLFPFVEKYTCSDVERQALSNKLDWNGMTIGRIGQISNFMKTSKDEIGTFIQAKPIRLEIPEASRVVDFIIQELQTGVYIL